jgi:cell division septum initiation protein DivIVA
MTSEPEGQAGPPNDPEQLKTEIEETRQRLGDTVDQLAAKTDVKARAQSKVADAQARAQAKVADAQARAQATVADAQAKVADVTQRAKEKTGQIREQAATAGETGREQLQSRTPEPVKRVAAQGAEGARRYRTQLVIAAGAVVAGVIVLRWLRRR